MICKFFLMCGIALDNFLLRAGTYIQEYRSGKQEAFASVVAIFDNLK